MVVVLPRPAERYQAPALQVSEEDNRHALEHRGEPRKPLIANIDAFIGEILLHLQSQAATERPSMQLKETIEGLLTQVRAHPENVAIVTEAQALLALLRRKQDLPLTETEAPLQGHARWQAEQTLHFAEMRGDTEAVVHMQQLLGHSAAEDQVQQLSA